VNVFFDNNLPPVYAQTLHGFLMHQGHAAVHIADFEDLPNGRKSTDLEWIDALRASPDTWIFVTGDRRLVRNRAERRAQQSAGLHGFILAAAFQKLPFNKAAAMIVWKWPDIARVVELLRPPSIHEIPVGRDSRLSQLGL